MGVMKIITKEGENREVWSRKGNCEGVVWAGINGKCNEKREGRVSNLLLQM